MDRRDIVINRTGQKGPSPRVCTQIRKRQEASITGKALIPLLENHHDWVPFLSAVHQCLQHGEPRGRIRGMCAVAGLQPHWDEGDIHGRTAYMTGVLASINTESLGRVGQDDKEGKLSFL